MSATDAWFSYEDVPLKWQYPIGLLFDLLAGASPTKPRTSATRPEPSPSQDEGASISLQRPWDLIVHFSEWPAEHLIPFDSLGKTHQDTFFQSVKEADYLRNGTAKAILSLSKDDSDNLWQSVQSHDSTKYFSIYRRFLNPPDGEGVRNIPIKAYIPAPPSLDANPSNDFEQPDRKGGLRVVQGLVPMTTSPSRSPQTLGTALHSLMPKLFPSRTLYIHARAILHGAVVPLSTKLQDLMQGAAFCDGFLHIAVAVMDLESLA